MAGAERTQDLRSVPITVRFSDEQLLTFKAIIDREIQEHADVDTLEQQLDAIEASPGTHRLIERWAATQLSSSAYAVDYRELVGEVKNHRSHEGKVVNVGEWNLDFEADMQPKNPERDFAGREIGKLVVEAFNRDTRKSLVACSFDMEGAPESEAYEWLGFILDPLQTEQEVEAYVITGDTPGIQSLLASLLVDGNE